MGKKKKKVLITWKLYRGLQKDFWTLRQRNKTEYVCDLVP